MEQWRKKKKNFHKLHQNTDERGHGKAVLLLYDEKALSVSYMVTALCPQVNILSQRDLKTGWIRQLLKADSDLKWPGA